MYREGYARLLWKSAASTALGTNALAIPLERPAPKGSLPFLMKSLLVLLLPVLSLTARAQSSTWDVHPLNMVPCQQWIYPEPGCGGCSSCRTAVDTDPQAMTGGPLQWSADLTMCPHPVDTLGNNAVIISDWPVEASEASYIYGSVQFYRPMRIDTLELTCAAWSPGIDSVEIAVQFNETDPMTTIPVLQGALSGAYQHYTVTGIGLVPMGESGTAVANFYVRTHGTDVWLLFKEMRVVASEDQTASIREVHDADIFIQPMNNGVNISTAGPTAASICDASGRITWSRNDVRGMVFVPLADGLSIVRAGTEVRRIVR